TARVPHGGGVHAWQQPERFFCAPETPHAEHRHFHTGKRGLHRRAVNRMPRRNRHFRNSAPQGFVGGYHLALARIKHKTIIDDDAGERTTALNDAVDAEQGTRLLEIAWGLPTGPRMTKTMVPGGFGFTPR